MRIVIVGAGLAGTNLALGLSRGGHLVTLVDQDKSAAERGFAEHGLATIIGDGTEPRVLIDADVGSADVIASMLRRDADNLAVAAIAQDLGAKRVLVRLRDPSYRSVYSRANIDQVFGEIETMVGALAVAVEHPRIRHSMVLGSGDSIAFEVVVPADAEVAGSAVRTIGTLPDFPRGAVIAGIASSTGSFAAPRGDSIVEGGNAVLLVARRDDVASTIELMTRIHAIP